jgi:hypothetical protein
MSIISKLTTLTIQAAAYINETASQVRSEINEQSERIIKAANRQLDKASKALTNKKLKDVIDTVVPVVTGNAQNLVDFAKNRARELGGLFNQATSQVDTWTKKISDTLNPRIKALSEKINSVAAQAMTDISATAKKFKKDLGSNLNKGIEVLKRHFSKLVEAINSAYQTIKVKFQRSH